MLAFHSARWRCCLSSYSTAASTYRCSHLGIEYMNRAGLSTVTAITFGTPSCDIFLLRHDPIALFKQCSTLAVSGRVQTLNPPPITLLFGLNSDHVTV